MNDNQLNQIVATLCELSQPKNQPINQQLIFYFPTNLFLQDSYVNTDQITQKIRQQQICTKKRQDLFKIHYYPGRSQIKYIYYKCKFCKAHINFLNKSNRLVLTKIQNLHNHKIQSDQHSMLLIKTQKKKSLIKSSPLIFDLRYYINDLKFFLDKNQYLYSIQCTIAQQQNFVVMISHKFLSHIQKYSQLIECNIIENCINTHSSYIIKYNAIILSGWDSNNRLLVFCVAIYLQNSFRSISRIFEYMQNATRVQLQSIVTEDLPIYYKLIQYLRNENLFYGIHLLNRNKLIQNFRLTIQLFLEQKQVQAFITQISNLITTTNFSEGTLQLQKIKEIVKNYTNDKLSELFHRFQIQIDKICWWRIPQIFIGIPNLPKKSLNCIINKKFNFQFQFLHFFEKFDRLTKGLFKKSQRMKKCFEHLQQLYSDNRIIPVRKNLQIILFRVFLKNYINSFKYIIKSFHDLHFSIQQSNFEIQNNITKQSFIITRMECQCKYYNKCGLPCEHLLILLRMVPQLCYLEFINERWIKQQRKQRCSNHIKVGRNKSTRRNHFKGY